MILLLSVLVGQNKETVIDFFVRGNLKLNWNSDVTFDHSEIAVPLSDLEENINAMAQ